MTQPFKALLVEGTSGAGKSTLIDALIRRHASVAKPRKIRSLVHLAQSHTYGPLAVPEDRGTLTADENVRHLERLVGTMEWLHAGVQEHTKPWCFVIIDTLHLTHCVRPGVANWRDVALFDGRLAALGCKLLFLRVSPSTIWERGITKRIEDQFIREYARKFGRTAQEIHQYFVCEQERLLKLFELSVMPKLLVDNERQAEGLLDDAYAFWTDQSPTDATSLSGRSLAS
jgi:thymidylate kinase